MQSIQMPENAETVKCVKLHKQFETSFTVYGDWKSVILVIRDLENLIVNLIESKSNLILSNCFRFKLLHIQLEIVPFICNIVAFNL